MDRLWVIAFKEVRTRFTDRRLLLIMLAAPLAIATIIGLAFGGLGRSTSPIQNIPVAVINHDQPGANGEAFGAILAGLLTQGKLPSGMDSSASSCPQPSASESSSSGSGLTVGELIQGTTFDDAAAQKLVADSTISAPNAAAGSPEYLDAAARAAIDKGTYAAVVIIPANYSVSLASIANPSQAPAAATVTVYANGGQELAGSIVHSVVDSITSQLVSGNIAIGATFAELAASQPAALAGASKLDLGKVFGCAFTPGNDLALLANVPVQASPTSTAGMLLVTFGSAQALFFALFTGQMGILSMYDERRNWTLQRMLASPLVHRLNLGPIPTQRVSWDQPHEGNLFEHLYARRAFQRAV